VHLAPGNGEEPELTLVGSFKSHDGSVKMAGAYRAAQEALKRGARGFLFVYEGPATGTTVFLEKTPITIGRLARDCEFALNDPLVSRKQCELQPVQGTFRLVDSGSKNGTHLNDRPVTEQNLVNGDQIGIGSSRIYVGIL
jgi:pSer/pThr/pTyr-binding forkhead associated (FHA) protein